MEYIVIWLLIYIEKFALLFSKGFTLMVVGIIGIMALYALSFFLSGDKEEYLSFAKRSKKYRVMSGTAIVIGMFMWSFSFIMPDRKELAVIIGGGMTYSVLTSTEAKDIGGKSIQIIRNKLDEVLKDQNDNSHSNIIVPPSDKVVPKDANYKPASLTDDVSTVTGIPCLQFNDNFVFQKSILSSCHL